VPAPARDEQPARGSRPKYREGSFRDGQNAVTKQHKDIGWSGVRIVFECQERRHTVQVRRNIFERIILSGVHGCSITPWLPRQIPASRLLSYSVVPWQV
jgi:hypothetical protein